MPKYEAVIGLETHIQLNTTTKIFCSCKADSWNDPPNTNICPICTGLPGVLPSLNKSAVEKGAILAAAMHATVQPISYFDRKNYFYPDLPKGYQISQFDMPLAQGGYLNIPVGEGDEAYIRRVQIQKLHLEEDAGKTRSAGNHRHIDFNRCGVPLIEMVTHPDLRSAEEAAEYITRLRQLIRWIGISEADMEKGHLRCDANVSIRPQGADYLNPKTEIKNVNSIASVRDAIEKEIKRQIREVEAGHKIESWTLEWDEDHGKLRKMRSKETEADYRYFREPDLLPINIDDEWMRNIYDHIPELPLERKSRFVNEYNLPVYDADILTSEISLSNYFEATIAEFNADPKQVSNWLINDVMRMMNAEGLQAGELRLTPNYLAMIIKLVDENKINTATAKSLLEKVQNTGTSPLELVEKEGLSQISDQNTIKSVCEQVLDENPGQVANYKDGKIGLIGWFIGQVMKKSHGKADPKLVKSTLEEMLK